MTDLESLYRELAREQRLRASALQRTKAARAEAITLHTRLDALLAAAAQDRQRLADMDALLRRAAADHEALRAECLRLEAERLRLEAVQHSITAEHERFLASTAWRATWPLRRTMEAVPPSLRRRARQALQLGWWAITGQLAKRLRR